MDSRRYWVLYFRRNNQLFLDSINVTPCISCYSPIILFGLIGSSFKVWGELGINNASAADMIVLLLKIVEKKVWNKE